MSALLKLTLAGYKEDNQLVIKAVTFCDSHLINIRIAESNLLNYLKAKGCTHFGYYSRLRVNPEV